MAEQLKGCLIVHAASIFTKKPLVNGLGADIALWIGKPADWIFTQKISCFWVKNLLYGADTKAIFHIITLTKQIRCLFERKYSMNKNLGSSDERGNQKTFSY
ncbi:hypothetical protein [Gemmiger formicilis]|uniref:hypothetical protein n=1 Tax=Gemmiger formicilis TaxID=745368 RepID=UPI003991B03D